MVWVILLCLLAAALAVGGRKAPRRRYRVFCFYAAVATIIALIWVAYDQYSASRLLDVSPVPAEE
jgi:hypothetical protein